MLIFNFMGLDHVNFRIRGFGSCFFKLVDLDHVDFSKFDDPDQVDSRIHNETLGATDNTNDGDNDPDDYGNGMTDDR